MQKKTTLFIGTLCLAIVGGGVWYQKSKTPAPIKTTGQPQQTAEEVLEERAKQAGSHLMNPLGRAVSEKNWTEVDKIYQPTAQFNEMAEIIRALFIGSKMKDYSTAEQDRLLAYLLNAVEALEDKNLHLAGLLFTQALRLPPPPHGSSNFKLLKKWLDDPKAHSLKRRVSIHKLALQDLKPDPAALQVFRQGLIQGNTFLSSRSEWIQLVDDTRNVNEQKKSAEYLLENYKKIPADAQPSALIVLSHHLELNQNQIRTYALQSFKSDQLPAFEASLRAISNLIHENLLKTPEKQLIVKKLTALPESLQSPFATAKSQELLKIIDIK